MCILEPGTLLEDKSVLALSLMLLLQFGDGKEEKEGKVVNCQNENKCVFSTYHLEQLSNFRWGVKEEKGKGKNREALL